MIMQLMIFMRNSIYLRALLMMMGMQLTIYMLLQNWKVDYMISNFLMEMGIYLKSLIPVITLSSNLIMALQVMLKVSWL